MKNKLLKLIAVAVSPFIILLFTGCLLETSETPVTATSAIQQQNSISVSGTGNVSIAPDEVSVRITILTEKSSSEEAVNQNSNITDEVIDTIKAENLENLKIETTGFNLQPLYDNNDEDKPPEIYAYRATNTIKATTTEIEKIGDIMATAIDSGANDVGSLSFNLSEEAKREAKQNALTEATQDAREKANAIANSLGLEIDKIYNITESGVSYPGPFYVEEAMAAAEAPEGRGVAPPPVSPGELEISANVEITFTFNH
ncbi:MAG: SIMPL domain-containing protein [Actinomycetota bacterium]